MCHCASGSIAIFQGLQLCVNIEHRGNQVNATPDANFHQNMNKHTGRVSGNLGGGKPLIQHLKMANIGGHSILNYLLDHEGGIGKLARRNRHGNRQNPERPTKYMAIDCEMITTQHAKSRVARCTVVNQYGYIVLDVYVDPASRVLDYRTPWSGITRRTIDQARANGNLWKFKDLQTHLLDLFRNRVVVGHNVRNDLDQLHFQKGSGIIAIDTQKYPEAGAQPGLKNLLNNKFGMQIQQGSEGHDSVEDACASMYLFRTQEAWFKERTFSYN